ncbi:EAL domain-containing protein [Mangrovitalea sediminis]|uniref:EAL domain-containing protein n=1 Tax=Mangrovitalea sediminis TaxID=1982043 RepID=UPI000BE59222|nr:EAL domain-containing protein [Mangrovitalea sediminis]
MEMAAERAELNVLILEDSEDDALLVVAYLTGKGYKLQWIRTDTESGLKRALAERQWDLILSDYTMPQFSGPEALKIVRSLNKEVPFIFVSGTIGEKAAVTAMQAGAQDYVIKGDLSRLPPAIEKALADAQTRRKHRLAEELLRKLSQVVEQAAESVFITDKQGLIEYVNPAFEVLTGYSSEEVLGQSPSFLKSGQHGPEYYSRLWNTILKENIFRDTITNRRKNGEIYFEETLIAPLINDQGEITHFVSTSRDVTEKVIAEETQARLQAIIEATTDIVAISDERGEILYLNRAGVELLGSSNLAVGDYPSSKEQAIALAQKLLKDALQAAARSDVWEREAYLETRDGLGVSLSQLVLAHRTDDGSVAYMSTIARNITERKRFEAELHHQATHDTLTGLANRVLLVEKLETEIYRNQRRGGYTAVLFLDLNNFKRVNDSLGHTTGDQLLQLAGERLRQHLRPSDILARYGGDEFVVVITDLVKPDHVLIILETLHQAFDRPFRIADTDLFVSFTTGIAFCPDDGTSVEALLQNADSAMYQAKSKGGREYRFYAPAMNERRHELLSLESELHWALARQEFVLHYQPQIDLCTGTVVGMEALLRWQHPQRGLVSPADFVPLLEETGLIVPVGLWVLRQACIDFRALWKTIDSRPRVSVNLSARQFSGGTLLEQVRMILAEEDFPAEALELEITEQMLMEDLKASGEILRELHELGVRVAIDDFGTGYSSMAYLKILPLNMLKIDRTFVKDLPDDANDAAISEAIIVLAHKLGLEVVAEGVETEEQLRFLERNGCNLIQGYYISRPEPVERLRQMVGLSVTPSR